MNRRKAKKISAWFNYEIGFSGCGPTLWDTKPKRKLGRKEKIFFQKIKHMIEAEKARRYDAFRMACIDVFGEDPDTDWC